MDFTYESPEGVWYTSPENWLFTGVLGCCGCGSSDDISVDVYNLFMVIGDKKDKLYNDIYKDRYSELIAHMFDSAELTEHGSSVGGSWLTEKGEKIYKHLKNAEK